MGTGRALWWIALTILAACRLSGTLGEPCLIESDCLEELECVYGLCREECLGTCNGTAKPCFRYVAQAPNPRAGMALAICLLPAEGLCESDFDCAATHFCRDTYCHAECDNDADCLADQRCIQRDQGLRLCEGGTILDGFAPPPVVGSCAFDNCQTSCPDGDDCVTNCADGLECQYRSYGATAEPGGGSATIVRFTTVGQCLPRPALPSDDPEACDVDPAASSSGCGDCGVCLPTDRDEVACRARCSSLQGGCGSRDLTCDPVVSACVERCDYDEQCWAVWDGDVLRVEPSTARCVDRICVEDPTDDGAPVGAPCASSADCSLSALCVGPRLANVVQHALYCPLLGGCERWTDGYCSHLACDRGQATCPAGTLCAQPPGVFTTMCLAECVVGAEPEEDQQGEGGHGATCRPGYACVWDGFSLGEPRGGCAIGNYNDVALNVGASCASDSECGSPFGLGACEGAKGARSGSCTVERCDSPGLPSDICGQNARCVDTSPGERACARTCETTSDCDGLQTCRDVVDRDGSLVRACVSRCDRDAECPDGTLCAGTEGSARCEPS